MRQTTPPLPQTFAAPFSCGASHSPPPPPHFICPAAHNRCTPAFRDHEFQSENRALPLIAYPQTDPRGHRSSPPPSDTARQLRALPNCENSTEAPQRPAPCQKARRAGPNGKTRFPRETSRTHHSPPGVQIHAASDQHGHPTVATRSTPRVRRPEPRPDTRRQSISETPERRGKGRAVSPGKHPHLASPARDMHCDAVIRIARRIRPVRTLRRSEHSGGPNTQAARAPRQAPPIPTATTHRPFHTGASTTLGPATDCLRHAVGGVPEVSGAIQQGLSTTNLRIAIEPLSPKSARECFKFPRPIAGEPRSSTHEERPNALFRSFGNTEPILRERTDDLSGTQSRSFRNSRPNSTHGRSGPFPAIADPLTFLTIL